MGYVLFCNTCFILQHPDDTLVSSKDSEIRWGKAVNSSYKTAPCKKKKGELGLVRAANLQLA